MLIVDLDDTLVASSKLNNDAYNYAIDKFGFAEINKIGRITKDDLFYIKHKSLKKIIAEKQKYFSRRWMINRLVVNKILLEKMKLLKKENCFIWTKSNRKRAKAMIKKLKLSRYVGKVIYDNKNNFTKSINLFKKHIGSGRVVIYENNKIEGYRIIDKIHDKNFNVNGYYVELCNN